MSFIQDILLYVYPLTLVLHLISVFSWMAGLFYLPRLFVHHVERGSNNSEIHKIFVNMEHKLLKLIMNPAMISSWMFGISLVFTPGIVDWSEGWPFVKAVMVIAMTWFHHAAAKWQKELADGQFFRTGRYFRLMNEVPTVLMIVIVSMVIARPF